MPRFDWSRHATLAAFGLAALCIISVAGTTSILNPLMMTSMGVFVMAVGMARAPRQPHLWEVDEIVTTGAPSDGKGHVGLVLTVVGAVIVAASFLSAVEVTSRLYGTDAWTEDNFGSSFTVLLTVVVFSGILVSLAGLTKMTGSTPFPHWRVRDRPPGTH